MNSPVIFAGALTIFAGALPRGPHPGDGVDVVLIVTAVSQVCGVADTIVRSRSTNKSVTYLLRLDGLVSTRYY